MKKETANILACPTCLHFPLKLRISKQTSSEIIEGELHCSVCGEKYQIQEGIPKMIPTPVRLDEKHRGIMEANIKYHDIAAETYEEDIEESIHQNEFNQKRIEKIIEDLSQRTTNDYFLDVGCGTGNLLKFGQKYFKNAVGIDVSLNMLKVAKERGYEVIQADALFLPFRPDVFDTVSIFSVLHHIYDYTLFFKEASKILKSGGFLYTDWDPQKRPQINEKKISWRLFVLLKFSLRPIKKLISKIYHSPSPKGINLREIWPETKKLYEIAEYHNIALKGEERGIDFDRLKETLIKNNFINIQPTFHWSGKTISQLPLSSKIRFFFLKFQDQPIERFMENIMTIAQKK